MGASIPTNEGWLRWNLRLTAELNAADTRATALAKNLTIDQLNWSPVPESWSIGQCLDHLSVTNEVYLGAIAESLAGREPDPVRDITPGWLGRWFIRNYIEASPKTKRAKAPRKTTPRAAVDAGILDRFLRTNNAIRAVIERARNYDVNRIRFRNPFVPLLRFTVGTGFEILVKHEDRHLLQAERVRQTTAFPS